MTDLQAIADVIRTSEISKDEKSLSALGRTFLKHLSLYGKMTGNHSKPVATRGTIYLYNDNVGVWDELQQEDAQSLIQCYDCRPLVGAREGAVLELEPLKCKKIHQAAILDIDHRDQEFFKSHKAGIAFKNGFAVVSPESVELLPRSPDNRATHCLPFDFNLEAECPEWAAVVKRVFKPSPSPEDDAKLLQEFAGACLLGIAHRYTRCLILEGGGENGKSVVVETIVEQLFPAAAVSYTSPQSWAKPEFLSVLRDAILNVCNEMSANDIQASDAFKAVIDGGAVTARNLYENPYTLFPRAGHIFLCNDLPGNRDNTKGFWRRILVLQFKRDFKKDPDEHGKSRTKEDVKEALRKELPGIAVWALYGAMRLLRQGGYTIPLSHRMAVEEWRYDADQVAAFLNECCLLDGGETQHAEIFKKFREWCELTGRQLVGNRKLAKRLRMLGVEEKTDREGLHFKLTVMMNGAWGVGKGASVNA